MSKKPGTTSLSNGTLSLRFMQRGVTQRVSTTAAKVSDEAEWDIGPAARAALGVSSGADPDIARRSPLIHVTRDDSYISFMFDHDTLGYTSQQDAKPEFVSELMEPGRRRIFRQGTEVTHEPSSKVEQQASEDSEAKDEGEKKATGSSTGGMMNLPKSISAPSSKSTTNPDPARPNASGVRRHRLEGLLRPSGGPPSGFVKPTGIASATNASAKRTREGDSIDESRRNDARRRRS
ncbi:hypothetical protein FRC07_002324 [Ceratobasidium sp. 392]|nr:hypothetical protein FRC07_002324 [Ceratobasidium sp. 392]